MKKTSQKILFFGNERLATGVGSTAPTFRALLASGYEIAALISSYTQARSRRNREPEIHEVARQHNIPIISPKRMSDIHDDIKKMDAVIGVLVAFGKIVPQSTIDLFPRGIINLHPSLLPEHRGSTPIESVILRGENKTGVSIMRLEAKMDAGPIYGQKTVQLKGSETKQHLADRLLQLGSEMIIEVLPDILSGKLEPKIQDESASSYDQPIQKQDGVIDWTNSAEAIERQIRAFHEWPQSKAVLNGLEVIITKGHAIDKQPKDQLPGSITLATEAPYITIATGTGLISIESLKPLGKNIMPAQAFLAGYKDKLAKKA